MLSQQKPVFKHKKIEQNKEEGEMQRVRGEKGWKDI